MHVTYVEQCSRYLTCFMTKNTFGNNVVYYIARSRYTSRHEIIGTLLCHRNKFYILALLFNLLCWILCWMHSQNHETSIFISNHITLIANDDALTVFNIPTLFSRRDRLYSAFFKNKVLPQSDRLHHCGNSYHTFEKTPDMKML